jgi:hypothetical protein
MHDYNNRDRICQIKLLFFNVLLIVFASDFRFYLFLRVLFLIFSLQFDNDRRAQVRIRAWLNVKVTETEKHVQNVCTGTTSVKWCLRRFCHQVTYSEEEAIGSIYRGHMQPDSAPQ